MSIFHKIWPFEQACACNLRGSAFASAASASTFAAFLAPWAQAVWADGLLQGFPAVAGGGVTQGRTAL